MIATPRENWWAALRRPAAVALAALAALLSAALLRQHAGATTGVLAAVCEAIPGAAFDCNGTMKSAWSVLSVPIPDVHRDLSISIRHLRVPVAFFGVAYFTWMTVWLALLGHRRSDYSIWQHLPLHVGRCGLVVSLLLVAVMLLGLAPRCLWCFIVHALNLGIVLLAGGIVARPETQSYGHRDAIGAFATVLAIVFAAGHYYLALSDHQRDVHTLDRYKTMVDAFQDDPAFLLREHQAQPRFEIPLRVTETSTPGQPRLVIFTDFECRACQCNALAVELEVKEIFDGDIDVHVRHFPLSAACNDTLASDAHPNACAAARAAEAARLLGGDEAFDAMCAQLYLNRSRLAEAPWAELAARIDVDPQALEELMNDPRVDQLVRDDIELGTRLGVTGTPVMFLDGRRITDVLQTRTFWTAVAGQPGRSQPPLAADRRQVGAR